MRIAILGGSFNPPHLAHVQVAKYLLQQRNYDRVWVFPTKQNPFKPLTVSFVDRLAMCRLAFAELGAAVAVRSDDDALTGYTIDLVTHLQAEYPDDEFVFVGGGDLRDQVKTWKDSDSLRERIEFEFLPRAPEESSPFLPFSSSMVRESVRLGGDLTKYLPASVAEYIAEQGLYLE